MFTITKIMLGSALPLFIFFMYRVFKHWKTEKSTYDRKSFIRATWGISYLSLGLIIFLQDFLIHPLVEAFLISFGYPKLLLESFFV